ncbi:MAG TPA: 6-hydroxymethylpterin diphosphokinase MptE-like protein [Methylomicrobium sp.]|nr:6-hydroxymethylpterin diphosphokinase MptE-like protein [Methylomicrobium sp.]
MDRSRNHIRELVRLHRPKTITEIGVAKLESARYLIGEALAFHDEVTYHGFDLFEPLTAELKATEFQGKEPWSYEKCCEVLREISLGLAKHGKTLDWHLYKGPTTQTLLDCPESARKADFCFIDGGHSTDTIKHDATALKDCSVVLFDDYYFEADNLIARVGCNLPVQELYQGDFAHMPIVERSVTPDRKPIMVGQVVYPRAAWPYARLAAVRHIVKAVKPKKAFVYGDLTICNYVARYVRDNGGEVTSDFALSDVDFAYVDCVAPGDNGAPVFMEKDEALDSWKRLEHVPVKAFGGLILGEDKKHRPAANGAGHILDAHTPNNMIVNTLDRLGDLEVGLFVTPAKAWPAQSQSFHVATKNCVDDSVIRNNILANAHRLPIIAPICAVHDYKLCFVSAGPSFMEHLEFIRSEQADGSYIVCVKHSHDALIKAGIIPWGCVLLDPRDHVKQFVQNPHPKTTYFVASMVHPTSLDILLAKGARVVGYHAMVGAGEANVLPKGTSFILGGTSSAMRGISLFLSMGFRDFTLVGYDSCYWEKPGDKQEKTKLGYNRYAKINVGGRKFWSELELIAQAQDFQELCKLLNNVELTGNVKLRVYGDGLIPHIWNLARPPLRISLDSFMRHIG